MNKCHFRFIGDKNYLKIKYRLIMGEKLNLNNPTKFNQKLQWLKLYDRNNKYTDLVDKAKVKDVVKKLIGEKYVIKTYGVYKNYDEINFDELPNSFVLKPTHTSGDVFICKNKSEINHEKLKRTINKWLRRNYYYLHREWPYKNIQPRVIAEEYMKNDNDENKSLTDYKVMCFNGEPQIIFTCTDRFNGGLKVTFFDLNWNKLPFSRHYPSSKDYIAKPKKLNEMISLSKKMSKNINFVRIDWYEINGQLYFGEYTFYPGSGFEEFLPKIWDEKIGKILKIEKNDNNE